MSDARTHGFDFDRDPDVSCRGPAPSGRRDDDFGPTVQEPAPGRRRDLTTAPRRESLRTRVDGAVRFDDLAADTDAAARSEELGADLSRLTPLVVEHQARVSEADAAAASARATIAKNNPRTDPGLKTDVTAPTQRVYKSFGERTANVALALFVLGFTAFVSGAGIATAVLFGWVKTAWVKDALKSAKAVAVQVMELVK